MDPEVLSNAILELRYFTKKLGDLKNIFEQEHERIQQKKRTIEQGKNLNKKFKNETSGSHSDTGSVVFLEEIKAIPQKTNEKETPQKTNETEEKNPEPKKSNDAKKLEYKIIKQKLKQLQSPKK